MAHRNTGQSLDHLLGFTAPSRPPPPSGNRKPKSSSGARSAPSLTRERRVHGQSRLRFVVDPTPGRERDYARALAEPDVPVPWDCVVGVRMVSFPDSPAAPSSSSLPQEDTTSEELMPVCPICLSPPTAPRMTKCGHIYCLSCVLHHLASPPPSEFSGTPASSTSSTPTPNKPRPTPIELAKKIRYSRTPRHCPVCWDVVYGSDLRPVWVWDQRSAAQVALDQVHRAALEPSADHLQREATCLRLMYRPEGSTVSLPLSPLWPAPPASHGFLTGVVDAQGAPSLPPYTFHPDAVFTRILRARPAEVLTRLQDDLDALHKERERTVSAMHALRPPPLPSTPRSAPTGSVQAAMASPSPGGGAVPYAALAKKLLGPQVAAEAASVQEQDLDSDGSLAFLDAAIALVSHTLDEVQGWTSPEGVVHRLAEEAYSDLNDALSSAPPNASVVPPPQGFTYYQSVGGAPVYLHPVDHSIVDRVARNYGSATHPVPLMLWVRSPTYASSGKGKAARSLSFAGEETVVDGALQRRYRILAPPLGSHLILVHVDWPTALLNDKPDKTHHQPDQLPAPMYASFGPRAPGDAPPTGEGETGSIPLVPLYPSASDLAQYKSALKQRQTVHQRKMRAEQLADYDKARSTHLANTEFEQSLDPEVRIRRHALQRDAPPRRGRHSHQAPPNVTQGAQGEGEDDPELRAALALSLQDVGMEIPSDLLPEESHESPEEVDQHHSHDEEEEGGDNHDAFLDWQDDARNWTRVKAPTPAAPSAPAGPKTVWGTRAVATDTTSVRNEDEWEHAWGTLAQNGSGGKKPKGKKSKPKGKVLSLTGGGRG